MKVAMFVFLSATLASVLCASDDARGGIDLIVMIDRSGSMSGRPVELLPALAADLLARNGEANRVRHRLAVVGFASRARVELPFTAIHDVAREHLERDRRESGGTTDVAAAFAAAARLFASIPADPARRRAAVIVTDGIPSVPRVDSAAYERDLRRFVANNFSCVTIDVLLVRGRGAAHDVLWRDLSSNHLYESAAIRDDLLSALYRVLTALAGTRTAESSLAAQTETIMLPPYLDFVVFDIIRGAGGDDVLVFAPRARQPVTAATTGVHLASLGAVMSTVFVNRPAPGAWTFQKSAADARVRVFSQQFFPRGVLIAPTPAEPLWQHDRVAVAYRVIDRNGRPLDEIAGYPLTLDLRLVTPEGRQIEAAMQRRPELGTAVFAAATAVACSVAGRYWTEVRVATRDDRQQQVEVFLDRWSGFSVADAILVECRLTTRALEPLVWSRGVDTRLECHDASGGAVDISAASPSVFRALLWRNHQPVAGEMSVEHLGRGVFAGSLHGAERPGSYTLRIVVDRVQVTGPYNVHVLPPEMSFTREVSWLDGIVLFVLATSLGTIGRTLHVRRRTYRAS